MIMTGVEPVVLSIVASSGGGSVTALSSPMLIKLNRQALVDEIKLKAWRLSIIVITAEFFISGRDAPMYFDRPDVATAATSRAKRAQLGLLKQVRDQGGLPSSQHGCNAKFSACDVQVQCWPLLSTPEQVPSFIHLGCTDGRISVFLRRQACGPAVPCR